MYYNSNIMHMYYNSNNMHFKKQKQGIARTKTTEISLQDWLIEENHRVQNLLFE